MFTDCVRFLQRLANNGPGAVGRDDGLRRDLIFAIGRDVEYLRAAGRGVVSSGCLPKMDIHIADVVCGVEQNFIELAT